MTPPGGQEVPTRAEALDLPLQAFPSGCLRVTCERCGEVRTVDTGRAPERQRAMPLRVLLARMRHEGCGGRVGRAELLTNLEHVSSRSLRRIVLRGQDQSASQARTSTKSPPT